MDRSQSYTTTDAETAIINAAQAGPLFTDEARAVELLHALNLDYSRLFDDLAALLPLASGDDVLSILHSMISQIDGPMTTGLLMLVETSKSSSS